MPLGVYAFLFALGYAYFNALLCLSQSVGDFIPAQVPLGIRSPYLNAWGNGNGPIRSWPGSYDLVSPSFYSLVPTSSLRDRDMVGQDMHELMASLGNGWGSAQFHGTSLLFQVSS